MTARNIISRSSTYHPQQVVLTLYGDYILHLGGEIGSRYIDKTTGELRPLTTSGQVGYFPHVTQGFNQSKASRAEKLLFINQYRTYSTNRRGKAYFQKKNDQMGW